MLIYSFITYLLALYYVQTINLLLLLLLFKRVFVHCVLFYIGLKINVLVCNYLYYCITCFTFVVSRKRRFSPCHYPKLVNYYCFYFTLLYTVELFKV